MATTSPLPDAHSVDMGDLRDKSLWLWELQHGCYGAVALERDTLYKHDPPALRYVPIVPRAAADLAPQYATAPSRRFDWPAPRARRVQMDGDNVVNLPRRAPTAADRQRWTEIVSDAYDAADVDGVTLAASRLEVAQRMQVGAWIPQASGFALRLEYYSPWQVYAEFADPEETDIRRASRVEVVIAASVPNAKEGHGRVEYGRRIWTQTEAWEEDEDGNYVRPVYDTLAHGFGEVPLWTVRSGPPVRPGLFLPPPNEALLSMAQSVCLGISDVEHFNRNSGPETMLTGEGAASLPSVMPRRVGGLTVVPVNDVDVTTIQPRPPVDQYRNSTQWQMTMFAIGERMSVPALVPSHALTGDAKEYDRADVEEARREREGMWRREERDKLRAFIRTWNRVSRRGFGLEPLPEQDGAFRLDIDYRYPKPKRNDLQESQSFALDSANGLDSAIERVARTEGIPLGIDLPATAAERVAWRLEQSAKARAMWPGTPPGLDRLDNNMGPPAPVGLPEPVDATA